MLTSVYHVSLLVALGTAGLSLCSGAMERFRWVFRSPVP